MATCFTIHRKITFRKLTVLVLAVSLICLSSGCSSENNTVTERPISEKQSVQNKIETVCLDESAYVYFTDRYQVTFNINQIKINPKARRFVYLGLMSFDEIAQVIQGYPSEQKYITLEAFKNSNWRAIQKDFDYLGKNSIEVLKSTDDDWSPRFGKRGYFYYKDPITKKIIGFGNHVCHHLSVPNSLLFNMNDSTIQISDLIKQINLPFEWKIETRDTGWFFWEAEKDWDVEETSFYIFELDDFWIGVTADRKGNIHPDDYTDIILPYRLGL